MFFKMEGRVLNSWSKKNVSRELLTQNKLVSLNLMHWKYSWL